jgi:hypothetical protein
MSSWFTRAFGYGLGVSVGRAIFGAGSEQKRRGSEEPIRPQTEDEILADEKRYDEEAKRYEAESNAKTGAKK